jgi:hypothetical protein
VIETNKIWLISENRNFNLRKADERNEILEKRDLKKRLRTRKILK